MCIFPPFSFNLLRLTITHHQKCVLKMLTLKCKINFVSIEMQKIYGNSRRKKQEKGLDCNRSKALQNHFNKKQTPISLV